MKQVTRRMVKRVVSVALLLAFCAGGVFFATMQIQEKEAQMAMSMPTEAPVIVLDAGHGGMDGGCSTADGVPEKGINLNILCNLRELLTVSGYTVVVTRDTDVSIHDSGIEGIANQKSSDMDNRLALFNQYDNAICISIHQNQFTDSKYSGAQMFYSESNPENAALAQTFQDAFRTMLQPENQRETKLCGKELFLCYYCENPTIMVECGFLSNLEEAAKLVTEEYQREVAFTIYAALQQYLVK